MTLEEVSVDESRGVRLLLLHEQCNFCETQRIFKRKPTQINNYRIKYVYIHKH